MDQVNKQAASSHPVVSERQVMDAGFQLLTGEQQSLANVCTSLISGSLIFSSFSPFAVSHRAAQCRREAGRLWVRTPAGSEKDFKNGTHCLSIPGWTWGGR